MTQIRSIFPLLIAAALLLSANGMQNTILALRAIDRDFPELVVGLLYSAYFVGFIAGCRYSTLFIAGVGHVRSFTAFASIASAATLAYTLIDVAGAWLVLRILSGFCMASLYMIIESWLNEVATNESRGRVLSIYRITDFMSLTAGQVAIGLFDPSAFPVFLIMSIFVSLALVPVALTRVAQPEPPTSAKLDLRRLWHVSPLAAVTAFGVGLTMSTILGLSPVFVLSLGYEAGSVGYFIAAVILGGAMAQWPMGWISDKIDRRYVLIATSIGALVMGSVVPTISALGQIQLIAVGAGFGAFLMPIFGLALAHANDHADPGMSVTVNGSLLMIFGVGAIIGPIFVPLLISTLGASVMFYWVSAVYAVLVLFSLYRLTQRRAPENQEAYVPVPRTTPAVFELDPRTEEKDECEEEDDGEESAQPSG